MIISPFHFLSLSLCFSFERFSTIFEGASSAKDSSSAKPSPSSAWSRSPPRSRTPSQFVPKQELEQRHGGKYLEPQCTSTPAQVDRPCVIKREIRSHFTVFPVTSASWSKMFLVCFSISFVSKSSRLFSKSSCLLSSSRTSRVVSSFVSLEKMIPALTCARNVSVLSSLFFLWT